ncbi:MAG: heavy-metal-associated domain-containing protein [Bacteroidales bacterium]
MKKVMMITVSVIFFAFITTNLNAQDADNTGELILETEMDCGKCSGEVKKQLAFTKGVKDVKADFVKDEVWIKYRTDKTDSKKLIASLDEIGYKATVKGEKAKSDKKSSGCPGAKAAGCAGKSTPCGAAKDK